MGRDGQGCTMSLSDLSADGEADAGSLVLLARVQSLENREDLILKLLGDADPVVFDGNGQ